LSRARGRFHGGPVLAKDAFAAVAQKNPRGFGVHVDIDADQIPERQSAHELRDRGFVELHSSRDLLLTNGVPDLLDQLLRGGEHQPLREGDPHFAQGRFNPTPPAHRCEPLGLPRPRLNGRNPRRFHLFISVDRQPEFRAPCERLSECPLAARNLTLYTK
jgi:hypothetical protein